MPSPTADSPAEPDISHVDPLAAATWFGHPRQLARLFSSEMWERFGFYGLRALLALYLSKHFLFDDATTTGLYGGYMALAYLTPLAGGLVADRWLGSKRSVRLGAVLMAAGYFTLCFGGPAARPYALVDGQRLEVREEAPNGIATRIVIDRGVGLAVRGRPDGSVALADADGRVVRVLPPGRFAAGAERRFGYVALLLVGLSLVTVGNGLFKPNISTIVGALYPPGDRRRDAGFTIFYMGINLGSLVSQLVCPVLAMALGWWAGFGLAGLGMCLAFCLFRFDGGRLAGYGEPPPGQARDLTAAVALGAVLCVPVAWLLFWNLMSAPAPAAGSGVAGYLLALPVMGKALFATFVVVVPGLLLWAARAGDRTELRMMLAAMVLIVFNVMFWTLYEQAGSSLTLFADRNVDRSIFGLVTMSAGQTQFFNPVTIVLFAPLLSWVWNRLAARGREPSTPVKFGIALAGIGGGFLMLAWATRFAGPDGRVSVWWLALLYAISSASELCISPVGLSMVTRLAIARIVGLMMGVWFLSMSVAEYVAGLVAQVASVPTVAGSVTDARLSLAVYARIFGGIGVAAVVVGIVLLALAPVIRRWMQDMRRESA